MVLWILYNNVLCFIVGCRTHVMKVINVLYKIYDKLVGGFVFTYKDSKQKIIIMVNFSRTRRGQNLLAGISLAQEF